MSNKRYFWLKLQSNFFDRDDVKLVESMDNGKDYVIFYMKLILKSINSNGKLRFKDTIPYNEKMLSHLTSTNIDIVRSALGVFIELGMMERWDDGTLFMNETANMIGSETSVAQRVRDSRARKAEEDKHPKLLQCNSNETKSNTEIEKELDIDLEIEEDKSKEDKTKPSKLADRFDEFWNEYPKARRINKKKCLSYWKNNKLDNQADLIINNLKNQVAKQYRYTEDRYVPHAYTYLNGERWTDPIIEVKRGSQDLSGQDYANDRGFD